VFVPVEPVRARKNQQAIITIIDDVKKEDKPFLKFIGTLSQESYEEITSALKDTQQVDTNEW